MSGSASWVLVVLAAFVLVCPVSPAQEKSQVTVLVGGRVYHPSGLKTGDVVNKSKIGLVGAQRVFDAIPEYQEIKRRNLDPNSAEYLLFMKKASDRFKGAINKTLSRGGYDLIAEAGAVTVKGKEIPDITDEVLGNL